MERHRVAIVIPAFNEAKTIGAVIEGAIATGIPIVVDDCSSDGTAAAAAKSGAVVVRSERNVGYDGAISLGFAKAAELRCAYVLTMDADGQHDASVLPRFTSALERGADLVIGIRKQKQRFAEWLFALFSGLCWGIRDPLCGLKAYRLQLYMQLGHFDSYQSIGTELMLFGARQRKKIVQIPIVTRARTDQPRFGSVISANKRILRALFRGMCR